MKLLLKNSISPRPLHKALTLLDGIRGQGDARFHGHELLALAKVLVNHAGNLHFGPEVGVGKIKADASVVAPWLAEIRRMAGHLEVLHGLADTPASIRLADARDLASLPKSSIDAVITSPPYPNEKDYTRTTRLESVLLGFINNREEKRALKRGLLRSNTRGVYKGDNDDRWIREHPEIEAIAHEIESKRISMGKTSGFERLYARVSKLYFGGMAQHLAEMRDILRPGAMLAYVVGDQASYLQVMIRTGEILGRIAQGLGYVLVGIDLFRTRLATTTRQMLREEVVLLRYPGNRN